MRLIDADEFEKRISEYNTTDIIDSILYNFAHSKLISMPTVEDKPQVEEKNICDRCGNKACIFDSHVARQKCDFYKPQKGWIPVSEELPEGLMIKTLVSCENDEGLPVCTMIAVYDGFKQKWDCDYRVKAWMPLPTPYEPQAEREEDG